MTLARVRAWIDRARPAAARRLRLLPHMASLSRSTARSVAELQAYRSREPRPLVAIALHGAMGDVVACEPVIRHVRTLHPDARLVYLTRAAHVPLVAHHPLVDRVQKILCLSEWINLAQAGLFDAVIDLHVHKQRCKICNLPIVKTGDCAKFTATNYLDFGPLLPTFALTAGLGPVEGSPRLHLPADRAWPTVDAVVGSRPFAVIHARSSSVQKDWRDDRWASLALGLQGKGLATIEVGARSPPAALHDPNPLHTNATGLLGVLETAELVRRAALFVGVDSGPAHLANAFAIPGVVLLGPFLNFRRYTPFSGGYGDGSSATLVRSQTAVADIELEEVMEAIADRLGRPRPPTA